MNLDVGCCFLVFIFTLYLRILIFFLLTSVCNCVPITKILYLNCDYSERYLVMQGPLPDAYFPMPSLNG
jgi:hypothetical protein